MCWVLLRDENREATTDFGKMEVIWDHNTRAVLVGVLGVGAWWEWGEERMGSRNNQFQKCLL